MDQDKILSAIKSHNEYKSDIAKADLIEINEKSFEVKFEGNFCLSCCMDEYFIDLVHDLKDEGIEANFKAFYQVDSRSFVAEYEKK